MTINIEKLIGKIEIHHHNGGQKENPCKDENLCNEIEVITTCYNKVAELLRWKILDSSKVIIFSDLNDTQNKAQSLFCKQDFEKEVSEAQPSSSLLPSHKLESKSIMLANILRQNYAPLDRVVQLLLTQETSRTPQRKKHGESLESCLLHQTANLLHILSARVIPHLEQLSHNKNQHS